MKDMYVNFVHVTFIESGFGFKARIGCGIECTPGIKTVQLLFVALHVKKVRSPVDWVPCNITGIIMAFEFDRN